MAAPFTTTFTADSHTWVVLPMGDVGTSLNTFWQLLEQTGHSWKLATPPGVADNGGLVRAGTTGVVVGVLGSDLLGFSPTAAWTGQSWTAGVLPARLAASPGSLASPTIALLGAGGTELMDGHARVKRSTLAAVATSCKLTALTSVASRPVLVGGTCAATGRVGLFESAGKTGWKDVGPAVHGAPGPTSVLSVIDSVHGIELLASLGRHELVAIHPSAGGWVVSRPLVLSDSERLVEIVPSPDGTPLALVASGAAGSPTAERAEVLDGSTWRTVASPPAGTQAVVVRDSTITAFEVHHSTLTVLEREHGAWTRTQRSTVPIEYGSSS